MNTYRTAQVAEIIGVHPNTVRMYEELGLIPKAERKANGYRIFTDLHIAVFRLARTAFQIEVLQNGLRKKMIEAVRFTASARYDEATALTESYLRQVGEEIRNAEDSIRFTEELLVGKHVPDGVKMRRREVSDLLQISMDQLRNWEMNGLLTVKRRENGYRVYTEEDVRRLRIIRSLRCANYSLESILRMLNALDRNPLADVKQLLNTPRANDDIIAVCDALITSLLRAAENAEDILRQLNDIKKKQE